MWYAYLADAVVALHAVYFCFVVLGQVAIWIGLALKWGWVRNAWFRLTHLAAIGIVALEALGGIACPLTVWEDSLRRLAGQQVTEGTFVGRLLDSLLFYDFPNWVLNSLHIGFALLVLGTFALAPPRFRRQGAGIRA